MKKAQLSYSNLQGQVIKGQKGSYEILKLIGSGSISVVYKAIRKEDNTFVAIKKVSSLTLINEKPNLYQLNELEISKKIQQINSQYLINIFEVIKLDNDNSVIVMEFCDGCDLHNFSLTFYINWRIAIQFGYQIACGVNILHKYNITHRDLKPENIFVKCSQNQSTKGEEYFLKIGDFGLSKEGDIYQSQVGTPNYMCPEQYQRGDKSQETDIWAFGLILFELIQKNQYFYSSKSNEVYQQIKNFKQYDRSRLNQIENPVILEKINNLIEKCIDIQPKNRISSQNLVDELKQILDVIDIVPHNERPKSLRISTQEYLEKLNQQEIFSSIFFVLTPEEMEFQEKKNNFFNGQNNLKKVESEMVETSTDCVNLQKTSDNINQDNTQLQNNKEEEKRQQSTLPYIEESQTQEQENLQEIQNKQIENQQKEEAFDQLPVNKSSSVNMFQRLDTREMSNKIQINVIDDIIKEELSTEIDNTTEIDSKIERQPSNQYFKSITEQLPAKQVTITLNGEDKLEKENRIEDKQCSYQNNQPMYQNRTIRDNDNENSSQNNNHTITKQENNQSVIDNQIGDDKEITEIFHSQFIQSQWTQEDKKNILACEKKVKNEDEDNDDQGKKEQKQIVVNKEISFNDRTIQEVDDYINKEDYDEFIGLAIKILQYKYTENQNQLVTDDFNSIHEIIKQTQFNVNVMFLLLLHSLHYRQNTFYKQIEQDIPPFLSKLQTPNALQLQQMLKKIFNSIQYQSSRESKKIIQEIVDYKHIDYFARKGNQNSTISPKDNFVYYQNDNNMK